MTTPGVLFGIDVERDPGRLSEVDVVLIEALRLYENGLCPDCRQPAMWTMNPRLERYFYLAEDQPVCAHCAMVESERAEDPKGKLRGQKVAIDNHVPDALAARK